MDRVVRAGVTSLNTETDVLTSLATAARVAGRVHDVMLMVELGDLREGVLPVDLHDTVRHVLEHPELRLTGIGTNLACRSGVAPSADNMGELCALADSVEAAFGIRLATVSGGNSANFEWAFAATDTGRINDLRVGEAILLGCEALHRQPIAGLHTDAVALVAEVIESKRKPTQPWGRIGQHAFGDGDVAEDRGDDLADDPRGRTHRHRPRASAPARRACRCSLRAATTSSPRPTGRCAPATRSVSRPGTPRCSGR